MDNAPVIIFAVLTLAFYRLGSDMFEPKVGLVAAVLFNGLPIFAALSLVTLPDLPLLLMWVLGMAFGWRLVSQRKPALWIVVGVLTGLGCDAKYPALLIPLGIFLYLIVVRDWDMLFNRWMVLGALVAFVCFLPVIIWNFDHEWVSILFQGKERLPEAISTKERVGSWLIQLGALSPFGFIALLAALYRGAESYRKPQVAYLLCWTLPFLGLMAFVSMRRGIHLNWPVPGYAGAVLLVSYVFVECSRRHPNRARLWAGLVLAGSALLWLPLYLGSIWPIPILNSGDDVHGWKPMGSRMISLQEGMPDPPHTFLAGHGYQAASMVAYYSKSPHITLSNNILGEKALGYDYFEQPRDFLSWDAVLMVYQTPRPDGSYRSRVALDEPSLQAVFEKVEGPEVLDVNRGGRALRRYLFYRCYNYQGPKRKKGHSSANNYERENYPLVCRCIRGVCDVTSMRRAFQALFLFTALLVGPVLGQEQPDSEQLQADPSQVRIRYVFNRFKDSSGASYTAPGVITDVSVPLNHRFRI